MYKPVGQNPPGMLDQGVQKEDNCCYNFFCWFFQLAVWGGIVATVILAILGSIDGDAAAGVYGGLGFVYVVYLILENALKMSLA